ncbi:hypothetical protein CBM2592_A190032 [Cupriavidus taiwanensis]|nr:hypothetical protein CBM2592_A190032 [Cupriavidus taiwanensis]SOY83056.1 hypothetical protein CBM2591_A230034 [Cupriavidus taiwanensis]SOZ56251.1 hypothetical protein CBM2617_A200039 [Cupriavidus taiwanensis]SOZ78826.1 hypothetical protein CBM2618_A180041 [Cupriavidus taiwanensis]SOZ79102.1 hypothetical protein CBM2622_A170039 [Cupriavidus taiwanensis]
MGRQTAPGRTRFPGLRAPTGPCARLGKGMGAPRPLWGRMGHGAAALPQSPGAGLQSLMLELDALALSLLPTTSERAAFRGRPARQGDAPERVPNSALGVGFLVKP